MEKTGSKRIDDLIGRAVRGDGYAFTALWDTYIDDLRTFLRGMSRNLDDMHIDDVCSRSFEKAFRQIEHFDSSRSQFFTWLKVIARNTALDLIDREKKMESCDVEMAENVNDGDATPLDFIIHSEEQLAQSDLIEGLPELYREVAKLRLVDGLQYKEIAEELGLELNTVRTRLRRAKAMLEQMNDDDEQ